MNPYFFLFPPYDGHPGRLVGFRRENPHFSFRALNGVDMDLLADGPGWPIRHPSGGCASHTFQVTFLTPHPGRPFRGRAFVRRIKAPAVGVVAMTSFETIEFD